MDIDGATLHALLAIHKNPGGLYAFEIANFVGLKVYQLQNLLRPLVDMGYLEVNKKNKKNFFESNPCYRVVPEMKKETESLSIEGFNKDVVYYEQIDFLAAEIDEKVLTCVDCLEFYQ